MGTDTTQVCIDFDESQWPLVVIRYPPIIDRTEWVDHLWKVEGILRRCQPFAVINDSRNGGAPTTEERKMVEDLYRRRQQETRRYWRGTAIVTTSPLVLGAVRGIAIAQPPPHPYEVFDDYEKAEAWTRVRLDDTRPTKPATVPHALPGSDLNRQEKAVALRVGRGLANKAISFELKVSESAVATTLKHIKMKLGLRSRADVINAFRQAPVRPVKATGLTGAERDVIARWLEGATVDDIAVVRGTSVATVRRHIHNAYIKLGVGSRSELIALGLSITAP